MAEIQESLEPTDMNAKLCVRMHSQKKTVLGKASIAAIRFEVGEKELRTVTRK